MMHVPVLIAAPLLDHALGEPSRFNPLRGLGACADWLEIRLNHGTPLQRRLKGALAWGLLVLPVSLLVAHLQPDGLAGAILDAVILWLCLGLRSLHEHTQPIAAALTRGDIDTARERTGWIVSRDTATLGPVDLTRAAIESILENGNDAVIAPLFWYALLGPGGAVAHRIINTLDAVWGYRTPRHEAFGGVAARMDDLAAWLPARLTAWTYALLGDTPRAMRCWRTQAHHLPSPNGGPCMTAGAGALGLVLGGPACYHGEWRDKPLFGEGKPPAAIDITRAMNLLRRSTLMVVVMLVTAGYML